MDNNEPSTVTIDELEKTIRLFFDVCRARGLREIPIMQSYYWQLDFDEMFRLPQAPGEPGVGDLLFELDQLRQIPPEGLGGMHLHWIAALLMYIGTRYPLLARSDSES
jgi:hypothetical protein